MWTVSRPAFHSLGFCLLAVYFFVSCHMEHVGLLYCSPAIYKTNIFSTVKSINGDFWICLSPPFTSFWLIIKGKMKSILGSTTRWGLAKDSAGQRSSAKTPPQTPPQTPPPYVTGGGRRGRATALPYCWVLHYFCLAQLFRLHLLCLNAYSQGFCTKRPFPKLFVLTFML